MMPFPIFHFSSLTRSPDETGDPATVGHVISSARGEQSTATTVERHEFQIFRRETPEIKDTIQLKVFH